ncbi:PD-(D/E)XK nuclease family protein [Pontibacter chinhatensis]|uniref:PD-(D/E)XK nuclease superfamily protein n=1 Tax=Pontibacter chinhatensis TaxID=1436961 RepID=A0A1I2ZTC2_9BACT|nr:PD-(D/E)XK nuclease family protein [Pontibacter chinhatensis]SFH40940.1 PD-(D/E)XK nuclease superfamily protein [Pontibacter chinhatensis]
MNIFKSLSQGNGQISETNITSFLSYLLNTSNELSNSFLLLFFDLMDRNSPGEKIYDLLGLNHGTLREKIIHFTNNYVVSATPEFPIRVDLTKQIADILVRVSAKRDETDVCYILIENKIKKASANPSQVSKQFEYFTNSAEYEQDVPVFSVLITTDSPAFSAMYKNALAANPDSVWLRWTSHTERDNSVEASLRQLIRHEMVAEITPINLNTQFIIKSFMDYIATEFSQKGTGVKNYSFNGFDEVASASFTLNGENYVLKRFGNNMVRVFNEDDEVLDTPVKPLLREVNDAYGFNIDLYHSTGIAKNTQIFGREIINALNNN